MKTTPSIVTESLLRHDLHHAARRKADEAAQSILDKVEVALKAAQKDCRVRVQRGLCWPFRKIVDIPVDLKREEAGIWVIVPQNDVGNPVILMAIPRCDLNADEAATGDASASVSLWFGSSYRSGLMTSDQVVCAFMDKIVAADGFVRPNPRHVRPDGTEHLKAP